MATQRFRTEKGKRGSDCTGADEALNRTYTLSHGNIVASSSAVYRNGDYLEEGTDYTISERVITFLIAIYNDNYLSFTYITEDTGIDSNTYASTLDVVRYIGIGTEVTNELLGTGDNTETGFDFDNGNVIDGSYSILYGPATGAATNNLTEMTESTHYNIDLDAGQILLTSAGKTLLATDKLYAKYVHCSKMSDTQLLSYLASSDRETDGLTGKYWGTPVAANEIFDCEQSFTYPTTDEPYARDYDQPDELQLKRGNITSVDGLYFLAKGTPLGSVQSYDSSTVTYVNNASNANTPGETGFAPFAAATGANDYLYVGSTYKFHGLQIKLFTIGATSGTNTIEYWNGTAWTAFTATEGTSGVLNFEATGKLSWSALTSWTKVSVNSSETLYFVRIKAATTYATEPIINSISMTQDFVVSQEIAPYSVDWDENGRIILENVRVPSGSRNLRVDYQHGQTSVPAMITELSAILTGLRVFVAITGGSYDDATHYALGRKEVTIGETYVNVREAVNQLNDRVKQLTPNLGSRFSLASI